MQANDTISCCRTKLIKMAAALSFPLPALLKQYWYSQRGERVRTCSILRNVRVNKAEPLD